MKVIHSALTLVLISSVSALAADVKLPEAATLLGAKVRYMYEPLTYRFDIADRILGKHRDLPETYPEQYESCFAKQTRILGEVLKTPELAGEIKLHSTLITSVAILLTDTEAGVSNIFGVGDDLYGPIVISIRPHFFGVTPPWSRSTCELVSEKALRQHVSKLAQIRREKNQDSVSAALEEINQSEATGEIEQH